MSETITPEQLPSNTASANKASQWDTVCEYGNAIDSTEQKDEGATILRSEAEAFLKALAPAGIITFQTLLDNKEPDEKKPNAKWWLNKTLHGDLARHFSTLAKSNLQGAGIFVMSNEGDGKGRAGNNVRSIRAIFVDLDDAPLENILSSPVPPSITVQSSPGRFHAYWLVREMPIKDFKPAQLALAAKFSGDSKVCDLPRLMRMPGFLHQKTKIPYRSRLLTCNPDCIYDWPTLADVMKLPISMKLAKRIPEGTRNSTLFRLAMDSCKDGIPESSRLVSLLTLNKERCDPPLSEVEVREIVAQAYQYKSEGSFKLPIALLDDDRFLQLTDGARLLLLLSYQRLKGNNNGDIALVWRDFKHHFPREKTFGTLRKQIVKAGLLTITRAATPPRGIEKPKPGLYKFNILAGD